MKLNKSNALKGLLILIATAIGLIMFIALPNLLSHALSAKNNLWLIIPIVMGAYISLLSLAYSLFLGYKLIIKLENDTFYDAITLMYLGYISYSFMLMSLIAFCLSPIFYIIAQKEDAPGILALWIIYTLALITFSLIISLFKDVIKKKVVV